MWSRPATAHAISELGERCGWTHDASKQRRLEKETLTAIGESVRLFVPIISANTERAKLRVRRAERSNASEFQSAHVPVIIDETTVTESYEKRKYSALEFVSSRVTRCG